MEGLYVVTHVDAVPPRAADAAGLLERYVADSRNDPGCIRFEVLRETPRQNHFTLVHAWQRREDFEAHSSAARTREFRERLHSMLGSPFDERLHTLLA